MARIGYTISCEEHDPRELVGHARRAEEVGFDFAVISDHFHPWVPRQGHSPFVWAVLGGIAEATERIDVGTGVSCPLFRIHPAIVAHAAATAATMLEGRFFLGLGTGERLNEHILGDQWPPASQRREMLEEAVELIREMWSGKIISHRGRHYEVANARLYTLPEEPPPIVLATAGEQMTKLAARIADGMVGLVPKPDVIETFERCGGEGKSRYGQLHVCWADDEQRAVATAREWWPNGAIPGNLFVELALPEHYESAASLVTDDAIADNVVCGPDPQRHADAIAEFVDAGYDHVYVHQVGPDQEGFFDFYESEVLPRITEFAPAGAAGTPE